MLFATDNVTNTIVHSDTVNIHCYASSQACDSRTFFTFQQFQKGNYLITVKFDLSALPQQIFDGVQLYVSTASPKYNLFAIILRILLILIAVVSLIVFCVRTKTNKELAFNLERRRVLRLSIAVILFNDPFFVFSTLFPKIWLDVVSVLCVTNFYKELLLFWIMMWWTAKEGQNARISTRVYLISVLIAVVFMALLTVQCVAEDVFTYFHPAISSTNTSVK